MLATRGLTTFCRSIRAFFLTSEVTSLFDSTSILRRDSGTKDVMDIFRNMRWCLLSCAAIWQFSHLDRSRPRQLSAKLPARSNDLASLRPTFIVLEPPKGYAGTGLAYPTLWQAGRTFLGVKILYLDSTCVIFMEYTYGITTSDRCKRMLENVMCHTRSRIKSYDQQIARVKAEISWMTPLSMRPARAWNTNARNTVTDYLAKPTERCQQFQDFLEPGLRNLACVRWVSRLDYFFEKTDRRRFRYPTLPWVECRGGGRVLTVHSMYPRVDV